MMQKMTKHCPDCDEYHEETLFDKVERYGFYLVVIMTIVAFAIMFIVRGIR